MTSLTHVLVMDRFKVALVSASTCLAVSVLMAAAKVALHGGFGASDLVPFFFWTILLSVLIGVTKTGLVALLQTRSLAISYAVSGIVGVIGGVLWTHFVAFWVGPYFRTFSFEVLTCWVVGSTSGLLVVQKHEALKSQLTISFVFIVVISMGALFGDRLLLSRLTNSREIQVVTVKWKPGSQALVNPPVLGLKLSNADLERLKSIGLTGQIEFASSAVFGEGKRGKVIIVISQQLKEATTLPQPDGIDVIYVQSPEGWKMYPSNAATLKRRIELLPDQRDPDSATLYFVENADGTRQGGTLVTW